MTKKRPLGRNPKAKIPTKLGVKAYSNLQAMIEHAQSISEAIMQMKKPPKPKKERLKQAYSPKPGTIIARIAEIAPKFMKSNNTYDLIGITAEIYSIPREEVTKRHCEALHSSLWKLKKEGLIPKTSRLSVKELRETTSKEIESGMPLVHWTLSHGHKYFPLMWRKYFDSYDEATQVGRSGLAKAIKTFDETKGTQFSTHAINWIAAYLRREALKQIVRFRREKRMLYLDEEIGEKGGKTKHEVIGKETEEPDFSEVVQRVFEAHKRGLPAEHAVIYTLRIMGHTLQEIGGHFGVTREAIRQNCNRTKIRIN